jgi:hypothetical protein
LQQARRRRWSKGVRRVLTSSTGYPRHHAEPLDCPPDPGQVSSMLVRALADVLRQREVSTETALGPGFAELCSGSFDRRVSLTEYNALLSRAIRLCHEPALGLCIGLQATEASFGLMSPLVAHTSATLASISANAWVLRRFTVRVRRCWLCLENVYRHRVCGEGARSAAPPSSTRVVGAVARAGRAQHRATFTAVDHGGARARPDATTWQTSRHDKCRATSQP